MFVWLWGDRQDNFGARDTPQIGLGTALWAAHLIQAGRWMGLGEVCPSHKKHWMSKASPEHSTYVTHVWTMSNMYAWHV